MIAFAYNLEPLGTQLLYALGCVTAVVLLWRGMIKLVEMGEKHNGGR